MADTKILIVEDEGIIALDLKRRLEAMGYSVCGTVPTGDDAIRLVDAEKPELILMDIVLQGDMDGIQTAEKILSQYEVPLIYLTAYADDQTLQRAKVTQPYAYVLKPFEDRELRTNIEIAIYRYKTEKELKRLQEQFFHAQKIDSIGQLASGIAHDFNNLLQIITGFSDIMMAGMDSGDPQMGYLQEIKMAGQKAAILTRQLLIFSRKHEVKLTTLNLNDIIRNMEKMLCRLLGEDIKLGTTLNPGLRNINADAGQLEQILVNLCVNARDAMPDGGRLGIRSDNISIVNQDTGLIRNSRAGEYVCVSVTDNGTGMGKETIQHIYEPFFSTKAPGKGTGLGLSVVYGIVKQHEGWISVYSEVGQGTTFKIYLPVAENEIQNDEKTVSAIPPRGRGERVLIVEDEEAIGRLAGKILSENSYKVEIALDSMQAREIFRNEGGNFDILFSDVILPDGNGIDTANDLVASNPRLRILMASGYTDDKIRYPVILEKGYELLHKPYTTLQMLQAFRRVLDK